MQRTGSIVVVDNDAAIVDMIVEVLTDEGYVAYSAPDGPGAVATIARHLPALILLDIQLPGRSGAELIAQMHEAGLATMPIVLMTTRLRDAELLLVPGSIECLAKPFNLYDLLARVANHVQPLGATTAPRNVAHARGFG